MERPESSLPPEVDAYLSDQYRAASVILEYGSGASTVSAAELPGKTIYSVESDRFWARNLKRYLQAAEVPSMPLVQHVDIGKTGKWGRPVDEQAWRNWYKYPTSIWDVPDFKQPDCVLVDGRFRIACLLTAMIRAEQEMTVLFDDYTDRRQYRVVEAMVKPVEFCGRMARFDIVPGAFPKEHLSTIVAAYNQPF